MENEICMAWITKYALTKGIYRDEIKLLGDGGAIAVRTKTYLAKPDWWSTREEAVMRAEALVKHKIDSLRKQIKALEEMSFVL
jgi:hypothetical protein